MVTYEPTADGRFRKTVLTQAEWKRALDEVWIDHRNWQDQFMQGDVTPPAEDEASVEVIFEHLCKLADVDYGYAHWAANAYSTLGSDQKFNPYGGLPIRLRDHMRAKEKS